MDCPYCGKEMKEGRILSGTTWREDGGDDWKGVPLCSGLLGNLPKSFLCPDCRKIILPIPEVESAPELVQRKLGEASEKLTGKLNTVREQLEERRSQASQVKRQKEKEKKGKKDPWEL